MKKTMVKVWGTPSSFLWTTIWTTRMTPNTDVAAATETPRKKPRLALAIATAFGVGHIPKAPGTFGSLAGIAVAILTHPISLIMIIWPSFFSGIGGLGLDVPMIHGHPAPGLLLIPSLAALVIVRLLGGSSSSPAATYADLQDPPYLVIDEVSGMHLTLVLAIIPLCLPPARFPPTQPTHFAPY